MSPNLVTNARRLSYLPVHQILKRWKRQPTPGRASETTFEAILDDHATGESEVFVQAGLSEVKSAFDVNPYDYLYKQLDHRFESILAPGFTDYFKESGLYHKLYSRPKHGAFSRLFLEDAEYRTDDAIKSILVKGPYRFEDCIHHDSYHPDGCFAKLVNDNVQVMNIGVPWFICSHIHYFESRFDVEYVTDKTYEGVIYRNETEHESITQTCGQTVSKYYSWNKPKLQRKLLKSDVIHAYNLNGLRIFFFKLGKMERVLADEIAGNEYYLVTL